MWDVLSLEKRDVTIGAVNIFFCMTDPKEWAVSANSVVKAIAS